MSTQSALKTKKSKKQTRNVYRAKNKANTSFVHRAPNSTVQSRKRTVNTSVALARKGNRSRGKRSGGSSRSSMTLTPPRRTITLEYVSMLTLSSTASTGRAYPIYSNGAYLPDPASPGGYTTTPGFSVPSTQYAAYRVKRYRGTIEFSTFTGAIPCETVVCHTNSLLGTSSGGTDAITLFNYKANRPKINTAKVLEPSGTAGVNPAKTIHHFSHSIASIAGESIMQPGYKSATNTVPAIPTYIVFGFVTRTSTTSSCAVQIKLLMDVEFLDYIDTLTSFSSSSPASEEERLRNLGTPAEIQPCAGCKWSRSLEYLPCPDPDCDIIDVCTNCGFQRKCSANCQSRLCPYRADTIPLIPPPMKKASSKANLKC